MTKFLLGTATAALLLGIPAAASAQRAPAAAIVVVDTERLFSECTACRAASAQLQSMIAQGQQRAQQLGQPLQAEMTSIQQAATATRSQPQGAARSAAEAALNQRVQALQTRQDAANQELQRLDQNIQSTRANVARQLNERLAPIYTQVMNAHGANLLMDVGATLAHAPALDVTNEVLTALNAAVPNVSVTPLPAPPPGTQPQGR
ncbi:MAG TPA: OmpH family outer membrane protein [Allosphingosinicella sp.]|jgi:Skp family chaperone for outer membrane proteins|nr:OmpH family outer membrane protein [Allosphingosinicella sp.]